MLGIQFPYKFCSSEFNTERGRHGVGLPGGSVVKNLPAMQGSQETQVQSLGQKDPLEAQQLTPVFSPGGSLGQRNRVGYSLWGRKELYTTDAT